MGGLFPMMWGIQKENGVWIAMTRQWRILWRGHDALYIAAGRLRLRIMKPWRSSAMRRYLYGWRCWFRALYMARTKKRGAGRQSWSNAMKQAACDRWIVDGQMRGAKPPRFICK